MNDILIVPYCGGTEMNIRLDTKNSFPNNYLLVQIKIILIIDEKKETRMCEQFLVKDIKREVDGVMVTSSYAFYAISKEARFTSIERVIGSGPFLDDVPLIRKNVISQLMYMIGTEKSLDLLHITYPPDPHKADIAMTHYDMVGEHFSLVLFTRDCGIAGKKLRCVVPFTSSTVEKKSRSSCIPTPSYGAKSDFPFLSKETLVDLSKMVFAYSNSTLEFQDMIKVKKTLSFV